MREKESYDGESRMIHVRLDMKCHKMLKIKVAEESRTIQDYVAELINAALNRNKPAGKGQKVD